MLSPQSENITMTMFATTNIAADSIRAGGMPEAVISNYAMAWAIIGSRHPDKVESLYTDFINSNLNSGGLERMIDMLEEMIVLPINKES